jgi:hypothetical protein
MNPNSLSFWDQVQLTLLRVLSLTLGLVDRLLNVHWGERLLERLASRWQARLEQLDRALASLQQERSRLHLHGEALALYAAAIYLGGRSLARDELRFDPADPHDEEILDATIDLLVKERLASITSQEIEPGHYVYSLEPDWPAIRARLSEAANQAPPDVANWFREGVCFIDEALLPQAAGNREYNLTGAE